MERYDNNEKSPQNENKPAQTQNNDLPLRQADKETVKQLRVIIAKFSNMFNFYEKMTTEQIKEASKIIIYKYPNITITDIKKAFTEALAGNLFEITRLDVYIIMKIIKIYMRKKYENGLLEKERYKSLPEPKLTDEQRAEIINRLNKFYQKFNDKNIKI